MTLLIRYRALPVKELFRELSRYDFIKSVSIPESGDFRESWTNAADSLYELDKSERDIVKSVGFSLGNSDVEGQLSMLEVNAALLKNNADKAGELYLKKGKMYRSFGVLGGLLAAVMII